jgi:putative ABC transport system substrate-binding protein
MKIFLSLLFVFTSLYAQKVLVLNSNNNIIKYKETVTAFSKEFEEPFTVLDISDKSEKVIREYLYNEYPDIVYTVGAKAYQYAHEYLPEKDIYFSSIVNWKRLHKNNNTYGVSNELHSSMDLTLIKSIFTNIKNISIIYSNYTQHIVEDFQISAQQLNMNIFPYKINKETINDETFTNLTKSIDAVIIIPDPILLNEQNTVKKLFSKSKKKKIAIFSYHELFLKYGAVLSISIDNPTTGRQIAAMIHKKNNNAKIQYPAGTKVIFNKKEALKQNIPFKKNISPFVNKVIE